MIDNGNYGWNIVVSDELMTQLLGGAASAGYAVIRSDRRKIMLTARLMLRGKQYMLQEERFIKIIEYLKEKGSARFPQIAEVAGVSENTVRKDLAELDKKEDHKPCKGRSCMEGGDLTRGDSQVRDIINREKKQELVKSLSRIVKNGQAVFMNGGTTNVEAAGFLAETYSRLTIISNNLTVLDMCRRKKEFQLILAGGVYYEPENTVIGKQVEQDVAMYNADIAVLSVNSISLKKRYNRFQDGRKRHNQCDDRKCRKSSSCGRQQQVRACRSYKCMSYKINILFLTDSSMDSEVFAKYKKHGVEIIMPESMRRRSDHAPVGGKNAA